MLERHKTKERQWGANGREERRKNKYEKEKYVPFECHYKLPKFHFGSLFFPPLRLSLALPPTLALLSLIM